MRPVAPEAPVGEKGVGWRGARSEVSDRVSRVHPTTFVLRRWHQHWLFQNLPRILKGKVEEWSRATSDPTLPVGRR